MNNQSIAFEMQFPANILVPVILFILLSPGIFLAIPTRAQRFQNVLFRAAIFAVIYGGLRIMFPQYYY